MNINYDELSPDEVSEIVKELQRRGFIELSKTDYKANSLYMALKKRGAKHPYISQDIRKPVFDLADYIFDNFEADGRKKIKRKTLPSDTLKRKKYIEFVDAIVEIIFPFYGKIGFREKETEV